jgi:hypothetical protein
MWLLNDETGKQPLTKTSTTVASPWKKRYRPPNNNNNNNTKKNKKKEII